MIQIDAVADIPALRSMWPELPASTVRWWASTGQLKQHGRDSRGRKLYLVQDVADLAASRNIR